MKSNNENFSKIINFIDFYIKENNYPPTVREICKKMNFKSTSTVQYYLDKMENQGLISRTNYKNRSITTINTSKTPFLSVPLIGTITAGLPIFAVENLDGYYPIPIEFSTDSDLFLLNVKGNSMINAGIFNGDKLIVKKQNCAKNGDIVVAYFDDGATVKRFYIKDNKIILHPENPEFSDFILDEVNILGIVQGLYRKF